MLYNNFETQFNDTVDFSKTIQVYDEPRKHYNVFLYSIMGYAVSSLRGSVRMRTYIPHQIVSWHKADSLKCAYERGQNPLYCIVTVY